MMKYLMGLIFFSAPRQTYLCGINAFVQNQRKKDSSRKRGQNIRRIQCFTLQ